MKKILPLLSMFFLSAFALSAQDISGTVKDAEGNLLANASVSLLNAKDSSVIKIALTNTTGVYQFNSINAGRYLTAVNYVGYNAAYSPVFEVGTSDVNVTTLALKKLSNNLKDLTVTAKKPIVEVKADKTILNVENTINATGSDALELLRNSPGVLVDKD